MMRSDKKKTITDIRHCRGLSSGNFVKKVNAYYHAAMYAFVANKHKQQEIFLLTYLSFLTGLSFCFYRPVVVAIAISFVIIAVLATFFLKKVLAYFLTLKNARVYAGIFFICYIIYLINLRYFTIVFVYLILALVIVFKDKYLEYKIGLSTNLNPIDQVLKDNKIIEDHFQKEMRLFFILRQVNGFILVFTLLCFSTVFQTTTDLEELRAISTFLTAQSLLLVFGFLNLFLLMVIRFLIIGYCNTKVGAVIIQKGITGVTILTVGYVFEPQLTHLLATGPLDPLPSAHIYAYQKKAWGYSAKTSEDIFVAKSYLSLTGS